ncbi:hypothetical protein QJQ45_010679 [Haematococcus lacustris]|nr:hypothetical protein QJQ45_010679 [Haematococcus lacustris]
MTGDYDDFDDDWQPDGTQPDVTQPDGMLLDGSQPDGTQPDGTQPDGSQPGGSRGDRDHDHQQRTFGWAKMQSDVFPSLSPSEITGPLFSLHDTPGLMKKSSAGDVNKGQQLQGLQGLPAELLDAILSQLDERRRLAVFRTSKLLATALLRMCPRIQLTYPTQHDVIGQNLRELAPFLTEALRNRQQPKLHLTLQPASSLLDAIEQSEEAEPAAAAVDAARLVAWMLGAVPLCGAVDSLAISWQNNLDLPWEPDFSAALASSFPSVTSLTFLECRLSIDHLANAISHPLLSPRLLHLKLELVIIPHEGQPGRSPFIGSRLQELRLHDVVDLDEEPEFLYGLLPLPPTLTELEVIGFYGDRWDWVSLAAAVSSLAQLQQLTLFNEHTGSDSQRPDFMALLSALAHLPSLHTLHMSEDVVGQVQLDALLALTQITSLQVAAFSGLTSSRASAACSWRQLELNLCESIKAGLVLGGHLSIATVDLLTEQYLTHSRRAAQQLTHPTVASSSSHSGPSISLASSSNHSGPSTSLASSSHSGPSTSLASSSSSRGTSCQGGQAAALGRASAVDKYRRCRTQAACLQAWAWAVAEARLHCPAPANDRARSDPQLHWPLPDDQVGPGGAGCEGQAARGCESNHQAGPGWASEGEVAGAKAWRHCPGARQQNWGSTGSVGIPGAAPASQAEVAWAGGYEAHPSFPVAMEQQQPGQECWEWGQGGGCSPPDQGGGRLGEAERRLGIASALATASAAICAALSSAAAAAALSPSADPAQTSTLMRPASQAGPADASSQPYPGSPADPSPSSPPSLPTDHTPKELSLAQLPWHITAGQGSGSQPPSAASSPGERCVLLLPPTAVREAWSDTRPGGPHQQGPGHEGPSQQEVGQEGLEDGWGWGVGGQGGALACGQVLLIPSFGARATQYGAMTGTALLPLPPSPPPPAGVPALGHQQSGAESCGGHSSTGGRGSSQGLGQASSNVTADQVTQRSTAAGGRPKRGAQPGPGPVPEAEAAAEDVTGGGPKAAAAAAAEAGPLNGLRGGQDGVGVEGGSCEVALLNPGPSAGAGAGVRAGPATGSVTAAESGAANRAGTGAGRRSAVGMAPAAWEAVHAALAVLHQHQVAPEELQAALGARGQSAGSLQQPSAAAWPQAPVLASKPTPAATVAVAGVSAQAMSAATGQGPSCRHTAPPRDRLPATLPQPPGHQRHPSLCSMPSSSSLATVSTTTPSLAHSQSLAHSIAAAAGSLKALETERLLQLLEADVAWFDDMLADGRPLATPAAAAAAAGPPPASPRPGTPAFPATQAGAPARQAAGQPQQPQLGQMGGEAVGGGDRGGSRLQRSTNTTSPDTSAAPHLITATAALATTYATASAADEAVRGPSAAAAAQAQTQTQAHRLRRSHSPCGVHTRSLGSGGWVSRSQGMDQGLTQGGSGHKRSCCGASSGDVLLSSTGAEGLSPYTASSAAAVLAAAVLIRGSGVPVDMRGSWPTARAALQQPLLPQRKQQQQGILQQHQQHLSQQQQQLAVLASGSRLLAWAPAPGPGSPLPAPGQAVEVEFSHSSLGSSSQQSSGSSSSSSRGGRQVSLVGSEVSSRGRGNSSTVYTKTSGPPPPQPGTKPKSLPAQQPVSQAPSQRASGHRLSPSPAAAAPADVGAAGPASNYMTTWLKKTAGLSHKQQELLLAALASRAKDRQAALLSSQATAHHPDQAAPPELARPASTKAALPAQTPGSKLQDSSANHASLPSRLSQAARDNSRTERHRGLATRASEVTAAQLQPFNRQRSLAAAFQAERQPASQSPLRRSLPTSDLVAALSHAKCAAGYTSYSVAPTAISVIEPRASSALPADQQARCAVREAQVGNSAQVGNGSGKRASQLDFARPHSPPRAQPIHQPFPVTSAQLLLRAQPPRQQQPGDSSELLPAERLLLEQLGVDFASRLAAQPAHPHQQQQQWLGMGIPAQAGQATPLQPSSLATNPVYDAKQTGSAPHLSPDPNWPHAAKGGVVEESAPAPSHLPAPCPSEPMAGQQEGHDGHGLQLHRGPADGSEAHTRWQVGSLAAASSHYAHQGHQDGCWPSHDPGAGLAQGLAQGPRTWLQLNPVFSEHHPDAG